MRQATEGVSRTSSVGSAAKDAYALGDVLVDALSRRRGRRPLRARGAYTHAELRA